MGGQTALGFHWSFLPPMEEKEFKVIKLPRNGPKPGQSVNAWLYGKKLEENRFQQIKEKKAFES